MWIYGDPLSLDDLMYTALVNAWGWAVGLASHDTPWQSVQFSGTGGISRYGSNVTFDIALHGFHNGVDTPPLLCCKAKVVDDSQCLAGEAQGGIAFGHPDGG